MRNKGKGFVEGDSQDIQGSHFFNLANQGVASQQTGVVVQVPDCWNFRFAGCKNRFVVVSPLFQGLGNVEKLVFRDLRVYVSVVKSKNYIISPCGYSDIRESFLNV